MARVAAWLRLWCGIAVASLAQADVVMVDPNGLFRFTWPGASDTW